MANVEHNHHAHHHEKMSMNSSDMSGMDMPMGDMTTTSDPHAMHNMNNMGGSDDSMGGMMVRIRNYMLIFSSILSLISS